MAGFSALRDDFATATVGSAWTAYTIGSATVTQTSGQARMTLPSSTAGSHESGYIANSPHDLTSDSWYINIETMVSTAVAAVALFDLRLTTGSGSANNVLRWQQVSNTVSAVSIVAGVSNTEYSATWSGTTYKYLRIRADTTTVYWDSSTNGTSWTNRTSKAISSLFPVTSLFALFAAQCGNVASPGSFRLDDVNLILPALSTTWRWTQARWPLPNRHRRITIAIDTAGTVQGYLITADGVDASGSPSGNVRYWSGPADGGRELTEQSSESAAQGNAVNLPLDASFDLPEQIDAMCFRLGHRSIDGSAYTIREFYPRRLVQSDDVEAESIRAINIAASTITVDKLDATLTITGKTIQTAYNGARVVLSGDSFGGFIGYGASDTYNPATGSGTYQVLWKLTDGKFYAGGGIVILDEDGIGITGPTFTFALNNLTPVIVPRENLIQWSETTADQAASLAGSTDGQLLGLGDRITLAIPIDTQYSYGLDLRANGAHSMTAASFAVKDPDSTAGNTLLVTTNLDETLSVVETGGDLNVGAGLNVGTATGAGDGEVRVTVTDSGTTNSPLILTLGHNSSGTPAANFGTATVWNLETTTTVDTNAFQLNVQWVTATHASRAARGRLFAYDTAARECIRMEASGSAPMLGVLGSTAVVRQTVTGSRGGNAALASFLTAMATFGWITDSTTA